jgi:recombination protein RecA
MHGDFINQIRMKIGVMFGSLKRPPGGNALKFYARCACPPHPALIQKKGEEIIGNETRVKVVKEQVAIPLAGSSTSCMAASSRLGGCSTWE